MEFLSNIVIDRCALKLRRSFTAGLLFLCVLLSSAQVFAASNDELLRIIERLEQRVEQLESPSPDVVTSTPTPLVTSPPAPLPTIPRQQEPRPVVQKIATTTPPVPPLELIPPMPTPVTEANGLWTLFLNIESADPAQLVQPFTWEDIRKTFQVIDNAGATRMLTVDVSMQGDGNRTRVGRSFLLRTNYRYDFRYVITYQLFLDDDRILSAQKYLSSDTLEIDHRGRIPPKIFYDLENQNVDQINEAPVQVRFGCQREPFTALTNRREGEAAFLQLNTYSCLGLNFDK